jgi:hypothetical protein
MNGVAVVAYAAVGNRTGHTATIASTQNTTYSYDAAKSVGAGRTAPSERDELPRRSETNCPVGARRTVSS